MKKPSPSRSAAQFVVRLPEGMRDQIFSRAKANDRSMNSEVVAMLHRALGASSPALEGLSDGALLDEVIARYGARQVTIVLAAKARDDAGNSVIDG